MKQFYKTVQQYLPIRIKELTQAVIKGASHQKELVPVRVRIIENRGKKIFPF